jgi:hypothetical protein
MLCKMFESRIRDLRTLAQQTKLMLDAGGGGIWWSNQLAKTEGVFDHTDPVAIRDHLFKKDELKDDIEKGLSGKVRMNAYASAAIQSDFLSALQREFIHRHRSRIEIMAQETARSAGHGDDAGIWIGQTHKRVKQVSEQGADK